MHTTLTTNEHLLVEQLLNGSTVKAAAKSIGIDYATARRWLKRPHIQEALHTTLARVQERAERSAQEIITEKYRAALEPACDAVVSIAISPLAPENARLKAAQMIQDRLAPILPKDVQPEQSSGPIPAELLPYLAEEEIGLIEQTLDRARERKREAEEKITPLRREA